MATILPFVIRPKAPGAPRLAAGESSVVIFPGVRYEPKDADGSNGKSKSASATRKRKNKAN